MSFDSLSLDPKILKAIAQAGYTAPTDIQLAAIPKITSGVDVRASAQTGTGKTAAFLWPALNKLQASEPLGRGPRLLILSPTRELAMQIATQAEKYSIYLKRMKSVCICGGVAYGLQMKQLSRPYEILIATPGRLIDYLHQGKIDLSHVEMLVLDEADRMLDMGFLEPVEEIVSRIPDNRQTLLFSATLQGEVLKLSKQLMRDPVDVVIETDSTTHENIEQKLHYADNLNHKNRLLDHILDGEDVEHTIIFTATKRHADQLVSELQDKGKRAAALHGDMSQRQRTRTIGQLRNGSIDVLVATDVAARGIDVKSVTHVVNFDLPRSAEDYVHRIGRTGRAGAKGTALSLVGGQDVALVKRIERFTGERIEVAEIEGLEPAQKKSAGDSRGEPSRGRFGNSFGGGRGRFGKPSGEKRGFEKPFKRSRNPGSFNNSSEEGHFARPSADRKPIFKRVSEEGHFSGRNSSFKERPFTDRKTSFNRASADRPSGDRKSSFKRALEESHFSDRKPSFNRFSEDRTLSDRKSSFKRGGEENSFSQRKPKFKRSANKGDFSRPSQEGGLKKNPFSKPESETRFARSAESRSFGKPRGRFKPTEVTTDDGSERRRPEGRVPKASTGRANGRFGKAHPGGQFKKPSTGRFGKPSKDGSSR